MASSSSSPSASAFSSRSWKYHVFLSFRGEDTRNSFVSHLYSALEQQGIYTYKDDETLPRGESIRPSLLKAIEDSQVAVIIFSKNYGDSPWCLDELEHIMKCKESINQTVIPIFYDVKPSEVRKQKRKYGEAFAKYELKNKSKVASWRKALVDASSISGWEPSKVANSDESKCIKQIVDEISLKLHLATPRVNENLIGMAARIQRLQSGLQNEAGGVHMIGIWGVGGGGKTTLASSVYDEISCNFDGCCFIENIREESSKNGLVALQNKILKGVLKQMQVPEIGRVEEGKHLIRGRLCHQKVLIVLDDIDHLDQLDALAGSVDWFGEGSRLIITTRDQHLLCRVDMIYNISLLNDHEAMELFCKHAPCGHKRIEDYEVLSKEVVSYAGGLPLALKVLGRFLCDKDMDVWRSALARLKEIPDTDIVSKLKVSYEGLQRDEKELFLDIACFYRWVHKDDAMERLDACGFHPVIGVNVLIQKALITISRDEYDQEMFDMHDLVEEMGHHIVRGEHPNNPEKHSRVWKREEIAKICAVDATTELDMIEAIHFSSQYRDDIPVHPLPQIVAKMKNLRLIDWQADRESSSPFPTNYLPTKLCYFRLESCSPKQFWEGYKLLPNLKIMNLYAMKNLIRTPDFDGLPSLESFVLCGCLYLEEIHPSIGHLKRLVLLSIVECRSLKIFPPISRLKKLKTLSFSTCSQLFKPLDIQQQNMEEPSSPHNNMNHLRLQFFFKDLRDLNLGRCRLGDEEMGSAVWDLPNLNILYLSDNKFSRLDFSLLRCPRLKLLDVSRCYYLVQVSDLPSSIAVVLVDNCSSLESFGDISNCKWLWNVSLSGWKNKVDVDKLLDSMLQGNATKDYFIQLILAYQIPKRFVGRMFRSKTFTLHLPEDWYTDFCGFLICIVSNYGSLNVDIIIKQKVDEDSSVEVCQGSNEAVEPYGKTTYLGYVSFGSLRHTTFSNSSYTMNSVEIDMHLERGVENERYIGVELVRRKSKGTTTDWSEYWHEQEPPFTVKQEPESSSINIKWQQLTWFV